MNLVARCAFGLEAIVARELQALGYETSISGPGQVNFSGDWQAIAKTNLWLRSADRVSIILQEFTCPDFDALFDTVREFDWSEWITPNGMAHVTGSSVKSQLTSVPAVQRTVKKAIVESRLAEVGGDKLDETGQRFRIHVSLRDDIARLTLDSTGPSLHKRGYREIATKAPLKETMAAALVQLSFWKPDRPLIDPFCGGGTILIEAAMIGRNIAPGLKREFVSEAWEQFPAEVWSEERRAAEGEQADSLPKKLIGTDIHGGALSLARRNAEFAGVEGDIHFQQKPFQELRTSHEYGCIVTNPPYGDRIDPEELRELYESIPMVLKNMPTWSHFILTAYPQFERLIGKQANRRRKLYNGRIECTYFQFHGPRPGSTSQREPVEQTANELLDEQPTQIESPRANAQPAPVFGGLTTQDQEQAKIFANRLKKRARHLRRWPTRRGITCYRLYERDIPEIPLVVDRYEDYLHIVEFERPHDRDLARHQSWLELMAKTAGEVLELPGENVFTKTRLRQKGLQQHEKLDAIGSEYVVQEAGLKFLVNLTDYTDTGLFLDHRAARAMVRDMAEGKRVLNLFAYTGAFSVYAAAGAAAEITTVDWSSTYVDWARRNFELNDLRGDQFRFVRQGTREFVAALPEEAEFDVVVCDPPTFSNSKRTDNVWDIQADHAWLLNKLLLHLSADGVIFFSSNYRRLKLDEQSLSGADVREITKRTLPEEFRNQRIHRSWLLRHC